MAKPYILVIRQLGGIGDVIAMTPVFRGLREKYPDHEIHFATAEVYLAGALYDIGTHIPKEFIDRIFVLEPYDATTDKTREVWAEHFGQAPKIETEAVFQRAALVVDLNTACVDYEWPAMHTPEGINKPRYEIWCEAAGVKPSSYFPLYEITDKERLTAQRYAYDHGWRADCRPVIGVAVASVDTKRGLGQGRLQAVCEILVERGARPVTIDSAFQFRDDKGEPLFDAIIGKRLRDIMPLIEQMDCVISADSGVMHMAGTVKTPVVAIFGPTDPDMRMKQYVGCAVDASKLVSCSPCWYKFPCLHHPNEYEHLLCLNSIPPEMIAEEAIRWATGVL